jgi:hypothetical protein
MGCFPPWCERQVKRFGWRLMTKAGVKRIKSDDIAA